MSSKTCSIFECQRSSRGLCDCCNQHLCLYHLNEHNQLLVLKLNPLMDDTTRLVDQINELISQNSTQHQQFDHLLFIKIEQQKESIINLEKKLSQFILHGETTQNDIDSIRLTINNLQRTVHQIERIYFKTENNSISLDESMMQLRKLCTQEFNASIFSHVYKIIKPPSESYRSLAANDRFLLIHQRPELCLLDRDLKIVKSVRWSHDIIHNINWSSVLKQFIILTTNVVYLLDPNTMFIRTIMKTDDKRFWSSACFNDRLFVTTNSWGSSVIEIALTPQIKFIKIWESPVTCSTDEFIDDIVGDNETLCFLIRNGQKQSIRMELRSIRTFKRLWSIDLDLLYNQTASFHCCSLGDCQEWLIADSLAGRFLQITSDGHLKQTFPYNAQPNRICFFGSNRLIITTKATLNIYKM